MKALLAAITVSLVSTLAQGQDYHFQSGYTNQNGTYVPGHFQTNPNHTPSDNWSTSGNTNPITGQPGYKNPNGGNSGGGYNPNPRYPGYQPPHQ